MVDEGNYCTCFCANASCRAAQRWGDALMRFMLTGCIEQMAYAHQLICSLPCLDPFTSPCHRLRWVADAGDKEQVDFDLRSNVSKAFSSRGDPAFRRQALLSVMHTTSPAQARNSTYSLKRLSLHHLGPFALIARQRQREAMPPPLAL